jgi:hypothetical protein
MIQNSQWVGGTSDTKLATIENVGIDHGGLQIAMAQQFLNRANVQAALKQVRGAGCGR